MNTALPIVCYDLDFKDMSKEVKKLNGLMVRAREIDWLLRQKQVKKQPHVEKFYKNVLKIGHLVNLERKQLRRATEYLVSNPSRGI